MTSFKLSALALLSTCSLASFAVGAAGLGDISVISPLGNRFRAEIPLANSSSPLGLSCFQLTTDSPDAIDDVPWLQDAQIVFLSAPPRLLITTRRPVAEPVLQLAIRSACGMSLTRHYTALLSPSPGEGSALPIIIPATSPGTGQANSGITPIRPTPSTQTRRAHAGETARDVAQRLYPRRPAAQQRFIRQMVKLNPEWGLSESGNDVLPEGVALRYPEINIRPPVSSKPAVPVKQADTKAANGDRLVIGASDVLPSPEPVAPTTMSGGIDQRLSDVGLQVVAMRSLLKALRAENSAPPPDIEIKLVEMETRLVTLQLNVARITLAHLTADSPVVDAVTPPAAETSGGADGSEKEILVQAPEPVMPDPVVSAPNPVAESSQLFSLGGLMLLGALGLGLTAVWYRRTRRGTDASGSADGQDAEEPKAWKSQKTVSVDPDTLPVVNEWDTPESSVEALIAGRSQIATSEIEQPIELANILLMYGRIPGAVDVLQSFIDEQPKNSLQATLRLLEIYKQGDMRPEFELAAEHLAQRFNIECVRWDDTLSPIVDITIDSTDQAGTPSVLGCMPNHIQSHVAAHWGSLECLDFLRRLLSDNREGARQGFSVAITQAILALIKTLERQLAVVRP